MLCWRKPATGIPRPEWYFLGLFQLLKYFPGRLEVIGALGVPGIVVTLLVLLPWLDRSPGREWRGRAAVAEHQAVLPGHRINPGGLVDDDARRRGSCR